MLSESEMGTVLADAASNLDVPVSCEVSLSDVMVNSPSRTVEDHSAEITEETNTEESQLDMFRSKASSPASGLWTTRRDGEVKLRLEQQGIGSETPKTVHELFQEAVKKYGDYFALASKKGDKWIKQTYKQYYEECRKAAKSFIKVQHKLPLLKAIIQYNGELKEKRPNLYTWSEFMSLGSDVPDSQLDKIIESQKPNQCCTLIYTSGTTGQPKGVMLSHDNITWTSLSAGRYVRLTEATEQQELVISYLPLSHIAAQMIDIWLPITFGAQVFFAQPDALKGSLIDTLQEVRPTAFMGVPRVWEKIQEKMKSVGAKSSALRRKVAAWAKEVGLQTNLKRMNGASELPVNFRLARQLVYKKVRKGLGLDRCTKCYTGAAPITRDTLEFFLSLDIPVYELYGMSESSGPHTISLPDAFRITSCGKEITGCRTMIYKPDSDGSGEICFSGRHIFMGYLNMEDKTKEAIHEEGWLHSGDLGKHDRNGFLYITGRIKELIITAGGENIPPVPIEDAVKEAVPIISNAMVVGDKAKFLAMLLTLKCNVNEETGEPQDDLTPEAIAYCLRLGSKATKVSDIIGGKDKAVDAAIQKGIALVNEKAISNAQKVQKWVLLEKDFSITGGELGPTMKLKRPVVAKMYKDQIDHFYTDGAATSANPLSK